MGRMANGNPQPARDRRGVLVAGALGAIVALALLAVALGGRPATPGASPSGSGSPGPSASAGPDSGSSSPSASGGPSVAPSGSAVAASPTAPAGPTGPAPTPVGSIGFTHLELAAEDPGPGGTYVIVGNAGSAPFDIGCWRVRTSLADLAVAGGTTVPPGGGVRFLFDRGQVDNPDQVELLDNAGRVMDGTPRLHDTAGDDQLFSRSGSGWTLGRAPLPGPLLDGGFQNPGGC